MANENRTVKVTLKAEIADYIANILKSEAAAAKFGKTATSAGSDIEKALAQSEKAAKSSEGTFSRWGKVALASVAAVVLAAGGIAASFITAGIESNAFAEQNQIALTTVLGNAEKARAFMDEVYQVAQETPFSFPGLTEQGKLLLNAGQDVETVIPILHAMAAAVAANGGTEAGLAQIGGVLQNIASAGKANATDINSIALAGVPAWQILAEAAGKSVDAVRSDVSAGLYDSQRTIDELTKGMESRYGAMLANMDDSYTRWQDRAKSAQRRTAEQLAVPVMEVGKEMLRGLTTIYNAQTAALEGVNWDPIIEPLMGVPDLLEDISSRISAGGVQDVVEGVGEGIELVAAAGTALYEISVPLVGVLVAGAQAGRPMLEVVTGLLQVFNALPAPIQLGLVALGALVQYRAPLAVFAATASTTSTNVMSAGRSFTMLRTEAMLAGATMPGVTAGLASVTTGARAAGTALLTAFGGPVGLAIAAAAVVATVAIGSWTAATAEQDAAVQSLTSSLDTNTGAITDATIKSIADSLDAKGAFEDMQALGVSYDGLVGSIVKGDGALEGTKKKLQAILDATRNSTEGEGFLQFDQATNALAAITAEQDRLQGALAATERQGIATGDAIASIDGPVDVDTSAAAANLEALTASAQTALASFINLTPQKKKAPARGGGGGSAGESSEVKAAKAEQKEIKKSADAAKKAADVFEDAARQKVRAAEEASDAAIKAAKEATDAETTALEHLEVATDGYVSAQRQRMAIETTIANTTDPARSANLSRALSDALANEAAALDRKTTAEKNAATATAATATTTSQATERAGEATTAQAAFEAATANASRVQEESAARIEAASERVAAATEAAASRGSGAVSDFAEDATESLDEYMARLREQIVAQEAWRDNMIRLSGRVSEETIAALMEMGASGAGIVAEMNTRSQAELDEMSGYFDRGAKDISAEFAIDMQRLGVIVPEITRRFGNDAAENLKSEFLAGRVGVDTIMHGLNADWDGKTMTLNIDAKTEAAIEKAGGVVAYINTLRPKIGVEFSLLDPAKKTASFNWAYRAAGGPIEGPGARGIDSVPVLAAPGEHMWTTAETDAVGGHAAMYKLRQMASKGMLRLAGGGPVTPTPPQMNLAGAAGNGGGGISIYNQIYYPQAEPTSVQNNRDLQMAGAL